GRRGHQQRINGGARSGRDRERRGIRAREGVPRRHTSDVLAAADGNALLPAAVRGEEPLEELLSRPSPADVAFARTLAGDVLVLGAGGKMGPSLARRVRRALEAAGGRGRVIAVSRFTEP